MYLHIYVGRSWASALLLLWIGRPGSSILVATGLANGVGLHITCGFCGGHTPGVSVCGSPFFDRSLNTSHGFVLLLFVLPACLPICRLLGPATDLRNIVGSDLGQDEIDEIFKQFDLNSDGEIDFE